MSRKIWTPAEFEKLSPAEQDEIFTNSIVRDLEAVPPAFLDRVRDRVQARIDGADTNRT